MYCSLGAYTFVKNSELYTKKDEMYLQHVSHTLIKTRKKPPINDNLEDNFAFGKNFTTCAL